MWITYFLTEAVTGWRPGEVGGLHIEDRIIEKIKTSDEVIAIKGIVAHRNVDNVKRKIKNGIKTSKRGVKIKAALMTSRLEEEFNLLEKEKVKNNDESPLWFHIQGIPTRSESANKHFKGACKRAGIERKGRTQYCLRHSLATDLHVVAEKDFVNRLMGHTKYRKEYDHRDGIALLKGLIGNYDKIEAIRDL